MSSIAAAWNPCATKTSWAAPSHRRRRAPLGRREVRRLVFTAGRGGCMTPSMLPAGSPTAPRPTGDYLRMDVRPAPLSPPGPRPAQRHPPAPPVRPTAPPRPPLSALLPPWPGEDVPVRDGDVFVRRTPWTGPLDGSD